MNDQARFIRDARKVLEPEELAFHKIPMWLGKRLTAYRNEHGLGRSGFGRPPREALGLTWHASSNTWHFPGHTVRITIHPKDRQ